MSTRHDLDANAALARLIAGNDRFVADTPQRPRADQERRSALEGGQSPFAIILSCADSRVAPELIFDQGLGDLFVIRVAGNILDDAAVLGSIEYAAALLGTNLVVVMGHQGCGAVQAALAGGTNTKAIDEIVRAIAPVVAKARDLDGDALENTVRLNASHVAQSLRSHQDVMKGLVQDKGVNIVSAYYHLGSGEVEFLDSEA